MATFRSITGLTWARRSRPRGGQAASPGSKKLIGLRLEQQIADSMSSFGLPPNSVIRGQWFAFRDANGLGYCQTDFILRCSDRLIILECKATYHSYALAQLNHLYIPIVSFVYNRPAIGFILTSKNWQSRLPEILS